MKKKILTFIIIFFSFLPLVYSAEIETGRVATTVGLILRKGPGTTNSKILTIPHNERIDILEWATSGSGCSSKWVKTTYNNRVGYVCSTYLSDLETKVVPDTPPEPPAPPVEPKTDEEIIDYLTKEGFPASYHNQLLAVKKAHPNWIIKKIDTKYSWVSALDNQDVTGRSLLRRSSSAIEGYLSTKAGDYNWEKDTFYPKDGTTWMQANREAIAYYMDPRNFLDEKRLFMFETLTYNKEYHTLKAVEDALSSTFLRQFAPYFLKAAVETGISPIYLASLSKQEVGTSSTNIVTNGKAGVLSDGVNYTGYYNFFNIGASSSGDPKLKSLQSAKAKGWDTPEKSIVEGAKWIGTGYILAGQDTLYFQKFNVSINATKGLWHQYQTDINATSGPAISTFNSYQNNGILELPHVFTIPVYSGMPTISKLPPMGNPNNWLKELKVNGINITNFSGENTNYEVTITSPTIKIEGFTVNSGAKVTGFGIFNVDKVTTYNIVVTAVNGDKKTYTLKVIKKEIPVVEIDLNKVIKESSYLISTTYIHNIAFGTNVEGFTKNIIKSNVGISVNIKDSDNIAKNEGTIVTGDRVTIATSGETRVYEVLIYGDVSKTGSIGIVDLGMVQKHLLGVQKLSGAQFKAADVNKDNIISIVDLGMIQKHILKISYIGQS